MGLAVKDIVERLMTIRWTLAGERRRTAWTLCNVSATRSTYWRGCERARSAPHQDSAAGV